jgi:hypothetical protein
MLKSRFKQAPQALRLESALFCKATSEQQFTLRASRGKEREAIVLRASQPRHRFFRSASAALGDLHCAWAEHILFGIDHLLFVFARHLKRLGFYAQLARCAAQGLQPTPDTTRFQHPPAVSCGAV